MAGDGHGGPLHDRRCDLRRRRRETFEAAPELAGTLPEAAAAGYAVTGRLFTGAAPEGRNIKPEFTGTLPKEAQHGERED